MKSNPSHYLNFYRETTGRRQCHWKIRARGGDIIAQSSKGYDNIAAATKGFDAFARSIILGRLDIRDYNIRSYEEHMRRLTLDQTLQIEKDNEKLKERIAELETELASARGEKPTPKPVTEEVAETTDAKPKGKRGE